MKKIFTVLLLGLLLIGCRSDSDVVSENLSKDSDNFKVQRRVVFYNGITGEYILEISGLCTRDNSSTVTTLGVVCKVGPNEYKKHMLGVSDNVTWFMEQIEPHKASPYFYKVVFKPSVIIPDIEIR